MSRFACVLTVAVALVASASAFLSGPQCGMLAAAAKMRRAADAHALRAGLPPIPPRNVRRTGGGGGGGGSEGDDDDDEEEYYESYAGDGDPQGMAERYQEAEDIFNEWEEDDRQREAEAKALGITMAELDAKEIMEDIGDHWKAWENPNKLTPKQQLVKNLQNETWVAEYKLELKEKETAKWAELDKLVAAKAASLEEGEKVQWADLEFDNNYV